MAKKNQKTANFDGSNIINITQWAIPTAILFVYVLVTLYSFSSDMKSDARYAVRQKVSEYNDSLIIAFDARMDVARAVASATSEVIAREIDSGDSLGEVMEQVVAPTLDNAYSIGASVVDLNGKGISATGSEVTVDKTEDFEKCISDKTVISSVPFDQGGAWYVNIYAPAMDTAGEIRSVIVYQFVADVFNDLPTTSKFDGRTCYALIASDGTIVSLAGRKILTRGENLFDSDNVSIAASTLNRTQNNLSNMNAGYTDCSIAGESRIMVYDPTSYSGLSIASFVTQSYLDNEIQTTYGDMESILIRVAVAMVAFFIAILAIHLANKAVNTRHSQTLQEKAETDLLTGLLNKMSTEQKVADYLADARTKNQSAILFLIDIDNFKKVNDTMGHAFGDELLAGLGLGLSTLFRATDIVGRIGGDEFLVLMRNVNPDEETKKREADKLLNFFRDFKVGEYVQYRCTASIGGAVFSQDGGDELYKAADTAMYESKRHGKNRVAYYGEKLEGPVIELGRH